jgi:hypothetical protein
LAEARKGSKTPTEHGRTAAKQRRRRGKERHGKPRCRLPENSSGCILFSVGYGYLSASVGRSAAAEVSAMEQLLSVKWTLDDLLQKRTFQHVTDGGNGARLHFPAKAENSQFALDGAEVVKPACFREAIGNPNNARKAR